MVSGSSQSRQSCWRGYWWLFVYITLLQSQCCHQLGTNSTSLAVVSAFVVVPRQTSTHHRNYAPNGGCYRSSNSNNGRVVTAAPPCSPLFAKTPSAKARMSDRWYPGVDRHVEETCLTITAALISNRLRTNKVSTTKTTTTIITQDSSLSTGSIPSQLQHHDDDDNTTTTLNRAYSLAQGQFQDLAMTSEGSHVLESLFDVRTIATTTDDSPNSHDVSWMDDDVMVHGCIHILQSLCIMGMLVGVKGTPEQEQRRVQHLKPQNDMDNKELSHHTDNDDAATTTTTNRHFQNRATIAQLKYKSDQTAGTQLLAQLSWKRTNQGAMDLLIALGVWTKHEDLALLRSGFPVSFTQHELQAAESVAATAAISPTTTSPTTVENNNKHDDDDDEITTLTNPDVDDILNIRRDLTHHKVYTIDSESTSEVDDGISIEELDDQGRYKFWIHIADADRWSPRNSAVFEIAKARTTTHYLPTGPIPMFPPSLSMNVMSLRPNMDTCALSLGVELNDDGSINVDSLEVTSSKVRVNYRLSYNDVDDMLLEGVGYREEWQLGAFLNAAIKRREYRIRNGSTEGMIPQSIPQSFVTVHEDATEPDGIGITVVVDPSHNQGFNRTSEMSSISGGDNQGGVVKTAISDSNLLVTEMMILAGEALGKWKVRVDEEPLTFCGRYENSLHLPFRSQPKPDFWAREKEFKILQDLLQYKHGYCHAWFARRFLSPVEIGQEPKPHFGLGIDCYVQWTSPIRRFGDLQVHAAVKRFLRRRRMHDLVFGGQDIPAGIGHADLGCPVPDETSSISDHDAALAAVDADIDYSWGKSLVAVSKAVNRQSQQYWLYEYISRQVQNGTPPTFEGIVLGCVDPERLQYAVYLPEIGYEHRYLSQKGYLNPGEILKLKVESVIPRMNLMTLSLINIG